jgi:hypothetical protein
MGVVDRQAQPKHHATIEEMLEAVFSMRFNPRLYREHEGGLGLHYNRCGSALRDTSQTP